MKILDANGKNLDVKQFTFPDGQIHVIPADPHASESVTIKARIRNGDELLAVLLANDALRFNGVREVNLEIAYMLAARMDRRMTSGEPFSLKVVAECLKGKFEKISVLDPHSDVTCALLDAHAVLPTQYVGEAIRRLGWKSGDSVGIGIPDAGAEKRDEELARLLGGFQTVQCLKKRDPATGKLSGFKILNRGDLPSWLLLVDDICDGGGTFNGLAELLRTYGVKWIGLYATHGIFSKGYKIDNIDHIFTTTSYRPREEYPTDLVTVLGDDLA